MMTETAQVTCLCQDCQGIDRPNTRNLTQERIISVV